MGRRSDEELRQMGKQLATFILQQTKTKPVSIANLQGFVADFTAFDTSLGPPLKDLVSRPSFLSLVGKVSSGSGQLQKEVLIEEISSIYASSVIHSINELLNGFLDLDPGRCDQPKSSMLASPQHFGGGSGMTSFYVDLPGRMLLLNLLSGGFYSFLWFYRHWRHYKRRALQGIPGQPKDPRILPIWSSLFCSFYIIGTARRIRAKMVELHLHGRQTKPLATFFLFNLPLLVGYFESTNNLAINAMMLLLTFCVSLLSSYQVYRLQKFANLTMKNEGDIGIPSRPLNLWDLGVVLMGGALTLLGSLGILIPASMLN